MKDTEIILGLFYSDENNLIHEKIKSSSILSEESREKLKMISFKCLGPVFLTAASTEENNWQIEFIESSLMLRQKLATKSDVLQTFFNLNSSIQNSYGTTNLFTLIGSPYTEDVDFIYDKMVRYIHPSIIEAKRVKDHFKRRKIIKREHYIEEELNRGINLIEYSLGSARKMHWKAQYKYYCVGVLERKTIELEKISFLYTLEKNNPLRNSILPFIPSYYVMVILPDYYENLVNEILEIYGKDNIVSIIRQIELSLGDKKVKYIEEHSNIGGIKTSYGAVLIPQIQEAKEINNLPFYRKKLREILDTKKNLEDILLQINSNFDIKKKWGTKSEQELNDIRAVLDT